MWTAKVVEKKFQAGALTVGVEFSDGKGDGFLETIRVYTSDDLHAQVRTILARLDSLETVFTSIPQGNFTPVPPASPTPNAKDVALKKLQAANELVTLGVLVKTDTEYSAALQEARTAFGK